jgi:protease I
MSMKLSFISRLKHWFLRFAQLQLLLSAVSLPILLGWGLPISALAPLGNLLFTPFLTIFLYLSTIIFFLEILYIPNGIFVWCLETVTSLWIKIMGLGNSPQWLIGFKTPPLLFLLAIAGIAFLIVFHKKTRSPGRSVLLLSLLLGCTSLGLKLCTHTTTTITKIPCNSGEVTIVTAYGKTIVIDPGFMGARVTAASWAEYTLAPAIIQASGGTTIDHFIALQPGICTFNALERLCSCMKIKNLYLPTWQGSLNKSGWRSFFTLKQAAERSGTKIARTGNTATTLNASPRLSFTITPLAEQIHYQECIYPALSVLGQIDNQLFTIYSAKKGDCGSLQEKKQGTAERKGSSTMNSVVLVIASEGYQSIEYSVPKSILENSGITVITASDKPGMATSQDGATTRIDTTLDKVSVDDIDALFFIGGTASLDHLDNEASHTLLNQIAKKRKPFGAICLSVRILAHAGVLVGKRATGWDGDSELEKIFKQAGATYIRNDVVVDGNLITAVGPHAAQEFGAKILNAISHR